MKLKFTVREIVEMALLIGLAIVFDLQGLKIQTGTNGGSISFTMLPLIVLALRVGFIKGFVGIGLIYGFITCFLDGWGFIYFPFDYLLAYGSLSFVGLFKDIIFDKNNQKGGVCALLISVIIALIFRFFFHSLSSMILYNFSFVAATIYNAPYVFISGAFVIAALLLLYKPLVIISNLHPLKSID